MKLEEVVAIRLKKAREVAGLRIPYQTGRPVHGKLDTDSSAKWTVIPRQTGQ